jgi:hypothetical protein
VVSVGQICGTSARFNKLSKLVVQLIERNRKASCGESLDKFVVRVHGSIYRTSSWFNKLNRVVRQVVVVCGTRLWNKFMGRVCSSIC